MAQGDLKVYLMVRLVADWSQGLKILLLQLTAQLGHFFAHPGIIHSIFLVHVFEMSLILPYQILSSSSMNFYIVADLSY